MFELEERVSIFQNEISSLNQQMLVSRNRQQDLEGRLNKTLTDLHEANELAEIERRRHAQNEQAQSRTITSLIESESTLKAQVEAITMEVDDLQRERDEMLAQFEAARMEYENALVASHEEIAKIRDDLLRSKFKLEKSEELIAGLTRGTDGEDASKSTVLSMLAHGASTGKTVVEAYAEISQIHADLAVERRKRTYYESKLREVLEQINEKEPLLCEIEEKMRKTELDAHEAYRRELEARDQLELLEQKIQEVNKKKDDLVEKAKNLQLGMYLAGAL